MNAHRQSGAGLTIIARRRRLQQSAALLRRPSRPDAKPAETKPGRASRSTAAPPRLLQPAASEPPAPVGPWPHFGH